MMEKRNEHLLIAVMCVGAVLLIGTLECVDAREAVKEVTVIAPADELPSGLYHVPREYFDDLSHWCVKEKVPLSIMARVAAVESDWNPYADNGQDYGMWQIHGEYLKWYGERFNDGKEFDPFDAKTATKVAVRYMAFLHDLLGDWRLAVAAYNCGYTRVLEKRVPESTKGYVSMVFGRNIDIF